MQNNLPALSLLTLHLKLGWASALFMWTHPHTDQILSTQGHGTTVGLPRAPMLLGDKKKIHSGDPVSGW